MMLPHTESNCGPIYYESIGYTCTVHHDLIFKELLDNL